jgi:hypothetical protein
MKHFLSDELVAQLHPTKNDSLDGSLLTSKSNRKVWWLGSCGHEWDAVVFSRTNGSTCPVCSGRRIVVGVNDLATTHPEVAAEWHPIKNFPLNLERIIAGSSARVWWQCELGHEWQAEIGNRTRREKSKPCPVCHNRQLLAGFNDLATTHPLLVTEWHQTKNDLPIESFMSGSSVKAWWQCNQGHEWKSMISSRAKDGTNCPVCSGRFAGTDLLLNNDLLKQWHSTKNTLTPSDVSPGSHIKIWWVCSQDHEWESMVSSRSRGLGCPVCSGKKLVVGVNDLATSNPFLASQWHSTKNVDVLLTEVGPSSIKKVWWKCVKGHEWEAQIRSRHQGNGCPVCSNMLIIPGVNDFTSTIKGQQLLPEWHWEKNQDLLPTHIAPSPATKVWWKCRKGHEWQAKVNDRYTKSYGCPQCRAHTYVSKPEIEILEFLTALGLSVEQSNRKLLGCNRELDLYIPDKKFGIEFNGLYWHSEAQGKGKGEQYHKAKYDAAKAAGIQLVQIWEDDWRDRKPTVMRALAHKLGVTSMLAQVHPELADVTSKVFARRTKVVLLTTQQAQVFLEANHIQGFASGSYYLGLEGVDGVLRAVMVLKREADAVLNIVRYATAGSVTGGFTKLLSHATKTYNPSSFITFADHTISDGGLYEKHGFVVDKLIKPDYMYVVRNERKHKFGYRLKRFRNDPNLLWEEGLTERELAALNNLHRIWDAGKTRYRLSVR